MELNKKMWETVFVLIVVITVLLAAWFWYARVKPHAPEDPLLKSVTAPAGEAPQFSKEIIRSVTAPRIGKPASEDVMKSLTAPATK